MRKRIWCILVAALACSAPARGQTFVRVTDAANPAVTDAFESTGGAWIDVDGDGDLDLVVPNGNLVNQNESLYLNHGGLGFERVSTGPVVTSGGPSIGACWGDYDRDGRPDLFVTNRNSTGNFLFHALGSGGFERILEGAPAADRLNSNSSSWVDLDNDGDLDLYVVNFQSDDTFYRNDGGPTWTLTPLIIPNLTPGSEFSIHGAWADFDNDGDLDLFVGHAGNQSDALRVNQGGLVFVTREIPDGRTTLGGSWGDFDNDGDLDFFAANYLNQGSLLYRNGGAPAFDLTPVTFDVFPASLGDAVGSAWGDVDNDGDLDLFVAQDNGQNELLYLNSGAPGYTLTRVTTGPFASSAGNSFGCSLADMDGDGDLDAFVANRSNQPNAMFENTSAPGAWIGLRLRGLLSNPQGIGARVRLRARIDGAPRWQSQQVLPLTGYNSQNLDLHFGLGSAAEADSIEIAWPSGIRQVLTHVAAGARVNITEDLSTPVFASVARTNATPGMVSVEWDAPGAGGRSVHVERAWRGDSWMEFATVLADRGTVHIDDSQPREGDRVGYRLRIQDGTDEVVAGQVWLDITGTTRFALTLVPRAPPHADLWYTLSQPNAGPVQLDVVDVRGRVRLSQVDRNGSAGTHQAALRGSRGLAPGVYWVRARSGTQTRLARAVITR